MLDAVKILWRGPLMRAFLITMAAGAVAFVAVPDAILIACLNVVSLSFAVAVVVTYAGDTWKAAIDPQPTIGQVLVFGVFLSQLGSALLRVTSIARRSFDMTWLASGDLISFSLMLVAIGALCHINAPEIVEGVVPRKQWLRVGRIFGVAVFFFTALLLLTERI